MPSRSYFFFGTAIFRLEALETGSIYSQWKQLMVFRADHYHVYFQKVSGVDINSLPLQQLRQELTIIPQGAQRRLSGRAN